jgi:hypothetical protein
MKTTETIIITAQVHISIAIIMPLADPGASIASEEIYSILMVEASEIKAIPVNNFIVNLF